jgi:hypothetical protein
MAAGLSKPANERAALIRITMADGTSRDVTRALRVRIQLGQKETTVPMLVLLVILDEVILGIDFRGTSKRSWRVAKQNYTCRLGTSRRAAEDTVAQDSHRIGALPPACPVARRKKPFRQPGTQDEIHTPGAEAGPSERGKVNSQQDVPQERPEKPPRTQE